MRDKKDELASWDENLMAGGTFNPIVTIKVDYTFLKEICIHKERGDENPYSSQISY